MHTVKKLTGVAIAAAAAGMFMTVGIGNAVAAEKGKTLCEGMSACKGKGACQTATSACQGKNACKGKGAAEMSEADCKAAQEKAKKT